MKWQKRVISARISASDTDGILSQQAAPSEPVEKVNHHSYNQPQTKSQPRDPRQAEHEIQTSQYTQDWYNRHPWCFECSRTIGFSPPQDPNTNAYERKGEERTDVRQVDHFIDACKHRAHADGNARQNSRDMRCPEPRVNFRKRPRKQSIARHREKDSRLTELKHQKHRRVRNYGAKRDDTHKHVSPPLDVRVLQRHRQRFGLLRRELLLQNAEGHDADEDRRDKNIDDGGNYERSDDADRQVARRATRLLGHSRYRIKADVCEKYDRSARLDSDPSVRQERMEVFGLHITPSHCNEESENDELEHYHRCINCGTLADSQDQNDRDECDDAERKYVKDDGYAENVRCALEKTWNAGCRSIVGG